MDTVIYNGKIYLKKHTFAQAVWIHNDIIQQVGTNEEIFSAAPQNCRRYDAQGKTIVPGFHDSHLHLLSAGQMMADIQLLGATSIAQVQQIARDYIEKTKPAPGTVLHGMGWNQDYFTDEKRLLTKQDLDAISTDYPIILERACAHILAANSKAIEMAGITESTPPAQGGAFDFDQEGKLTGVFRENACEQILSIRGKATAESTKQALRMAMDYAAQWGITSVQTMDLRPGSWKQTLQIYQEVQKNPTLRVYHQCSFMKKADFQEFLQTGYKTGVGDIYNRIGPLKLFIDGSLGARTALMRQPYHDDPSTKGISTLTKEQTKELVELAAENDCQVVVHAIGDGAVEQMLDCYEPLCKDGKNPLRLGIVHCQITDIPLLERFAKNDILALVQPIFLHYDMRVVEDRVGKELASTSYAFESLRRLGVHTSFGTDAPIEDMNPIDNLYCAVTRKNLEGNPQGGFYPQECIDIFDAVDAYTWESAYASFEEDKKGRIQPGYYADMAILSHDIFTMPTDELRKTKVDATIMAGRFVYERDGIEKLVDKDR